MRLLFFIDTFSSGGKERRLMELMKGLKARSDIDFGLVILSNDIHFKEVIDLGIPIFNVVRKTKKDFSLFKKIYQICKDFKPDAVHCWDSMSAVYLVPVLKLLGIKLINGMVTDAPENTGMFNKAWLRAQLTFPFSKLVVGNSKAGLKAYNAPASKSICIRNGFNFQRLTLVNRNGGMKQAVGIDTQYVVGMVASFSVYKDYKTYFKAAQLILEKRKDVTFLAIGPNTDSDEAMSLIEKQHQDRIKLLGKKTGIEAYIDTMDVCVLSTFTEGISNSILEYMAMRKPVVATAGGGTDEIVVDNITGLLVDQRDAVQLAEKIETLLDDEVLRNQMGEAGRARIEATFSIDKMVDDFIINYQRLTGKKATVKSERVEAVASNS